MPPDRIRALRERENLSQPVFARYLNVSKNLVSAWERGVKKLGGPALRLLSVVEKKWNSGDCLSGWILYPETCP